jgi:hypothetical protein
MILPILSFHQPYAYLMASGLKPIENRSWVIECEGPFLFHAAQKCTRKKYLQVREIALRNGVEFVDFPPFEELELGGLVGATAGVVQVLPPKPADDGWHFAEHYGHVLGPVARLPFRDMKGQQGWWRTKIDDEEREILEYNGVLPVAEHKQAACNCDFTVLCERCRRVVGECYLRPQETALCLDC